MRVFEHVNTGNLKEFRDQKVELACVVTSVAKQISRRNGSEWGRITVEDFHGTATVLAFGEAWERHRDALAQDAALLIRGSVSGRERDEDAPPIFLDDVAPLAEIRKTDAIAVELRLSPDRGDADAISVATRALRASPGESPLFVRWLPAPRAAAEDGEAGAGGAEGRGANGNGASGERRFRSRTITVTPTEALLEELRGLFGVDHVRLVRT